MNLLVEDGVKTYKILRIDGKTVLVSTKKDWNVRKGDVRMICGKLYYADKWCRDTHMIVAWRPIDEGVEYAIMEELKTLMD